MVNKSAGIEKEKSFEDVLKMFAPGTSLRTSLDDLLRARMGALIVLESEGVDDILEKGFRINAKFSSQRLVELAKMDGAIILSRDAKKIMQANALLIPEVNIATRETGTRHKAAERTARQANTIVIAVSERKNKITLYYRDMRYELERSSEILRRASETLQILEKQKESFDDLLTNFNLLEINNLVTINDVCGILQKLEILKRISDSVKRYLLELGKEGLIVSMRLKELIGNLTKEKEIIFKDYFDLDAKQAKNVLESMNFDFLLDVSNIARMLFEELHDKEISPKGYRILSKMDMLDRHRDSLIGVFKNLDKILSASDDDLLHIFEKVELVNSFNKELNNLKEKIIVGKGV